MLPQIKRFQRVFLLLLVSLLLWLIPNPAAISLNQETLTPSNNVNLPSEQVVTSRSGLDPNNIPSEKVNQFVHACLQVVALIERREGELQGSETESESSRIEQEIEAEALAIIEKNGLTRQEYLQLLGLANTDPEFGERIAIQLQEATS